MQYGDGLTSEPTLILLLKGSLSGARRVSGQNRKAREYADDFDPPIAFHCGSVMRFVVSLRSGTDLQEIRAGMLIGIQ
ncbi:MAG TPA: hypothetical protein VE715_15960 [Blastocatellia bacterium]|nr:hypothetical protein [Blastocatellia bacterium]